MVGKRILHYEIRRKLGEGGMGEVYLARDTKLDREVALKVLPEHLAGEPERRMRFEREAKAVAALKHPNIVTIYAVEETDGVLFITMEFVDGEALSAMIAPGGLALDRFFAYAIPLADAISGAHERNITHRDLKPANVMIDRDGRLKVLDFGLAKLLDPEINAEEARTVVRTSDTAAGQILGTAAYMSPEQAEGKPVDHRSDIFSLGIVLYEMATGERPFKGDTRISTISSILKDTPPNVTQLKHTLPRHLGRIIHRCLEKDPDRRFQSTKDIRNELEGLKKEIETGELPVSDVSMVSGLGPAPVAPPPAPGSDPAHSGMTPPPSGASPASSTSGLGVPTPAWRARLPWAVVALVVIVAAVVIWRMRSSGPESTFSFSDGTGRTVVTTGPEGSRSVTIADEEGSVTIAPPRPPRDGGRTMAVVLPFENLGPPEDAYFAAGVTEEITTRLAAVSGIGVISRTSAVQYDRSGKTMREIGDDLGVDYVLEGSVRWAKKADGTGRVRITPQLIRVADDTHLWSDTFDRDIDDIFEVQTDIAKHVIDELGVTLLGEEQELVDAKPTDNMEAYELYLRAIEQQNVAGSSDPIEYDKTIVDLLGRATQLDPSFVAAWYRLARHHADQYRVLDRTEARLAKAKAAVAGAAAADPDHYQTRMARGYYYYYGFREYDRALEEFQAAAAAMPNDSDAKAAIGYILRRQGKFGESIAAHEAALELDPQNTEVVTNLASTYAATRQFERAIDLYDRALQLDPDPETASSKATAIVAWRGDVAAARRALSVAPSGGGFAYYFGDYVLSMYERQYDRAAAALDPLPEGSPLIRGVKYLLLGVAQLAADDPRATPSLETAADVLGEIVEASPGNWQVRQFLALAYACLGRGEDAVREAKLAIDLTAKDLFSGPQALQTLATVYTITGREEEAIDIIERLLEKQYESPLTVPLLEIDPAWDALRGNGRFQELLKTRQRS